MKEMKRILVPVDFTGRSINALKHAIEIVEKLPSQLFLLHVYHRRVFRLHPSLEGEIFNMRDLQAYSLKRMGRKVEHKFKKLIRQAPQLTEMTYSTRKVLGNTENEILSFAKNNQVDLIVMGSQPVYGLDELWGNTTSHVVESANCPVLVIPENSEKLVLQKIALACDYKKMNLCILDFLKELAEVCEAELDIINVSPSGFRKSEKEIMQALGLNDYIKNVKHKFKYFDEEDVEEGLVKYVKSNRVGILAMVTKHRSFWGKIFHESLTQKMALHARVPLLTLHSN
ncbi:MAG: universal stress protein [Candidatus Cyclobacteriaceae bacterium M3_2C_046]